MTTTNPSTTPTGTEAEVVRDLTIEAHTTDLAVIDPTRVYKLITPAGAQVADVDLERLLPAPRRAAGTVRLDDVNSLVTYVRRHETDLNADTVSETARAAKAELAGTVVIADVAHTTITAVLNGHGPGQTPGWGDLRATVKFAHSPEWARWLAHDREWLAQLDFAEHIEEGVADISSPDGATMLELAQTLQAKSNADFRSQQVLANGQRQFTYVETVDGRGGQSGQLEIPQTFQLALPPFEHSAALFTVKARFQFRIRDHVLRMRYLLTDPAATVRQAFDELVDDLDGQLGLRSFRGTAPGA